MSPKNQLHRAIPCFLIIFLLCSTLVSQAQIIRTFAGDATGDGKSAISIGIFDYDAFATDKAENLYVFDKLNKSIRKIDAVTGIISTIAGGGQIRSGDSIPALSAYLNPVHSLALDELGNIYIGENSCIRKFDKATGAVLLVAGRWPGFSGDGGLAVDAGFNSISSMTADSLGNIYLTDNQRIRKIDASTGIINTIGGTGSVGYSGDGGPAINAEFVAPSHITFDRAGNIYIVDNNQNVIRKITASTGIVTTVGGVAGSPGFSGDGGPATAAQLSYPGSMRADAQGNLYISDNNRIRKITAATGIINTIAGSGAGGNTGDGGPASAATFSMPRTIALGNNGNIYIEDFGNFVIRKITGATGIINRFAGNGSIGYSGIGGPLSEAQIHDPQDMAMDRSGNIYLSDFINNKIYKIDAATHIITTVAGTGELFSNTGNGGPATAASISHPGSIATDALGNFYVVDGPFYIRKVDVSTGIITQIAGDGSYGYSGDGGPSSSSSFNNIAGITIDAANNIYIADRDNHRIRKIQSSTGIISTVAGNGSNGYSGDGTLATSASLSYPLGVTVDRNGNLYITDNGSYVVRRVDAITGIITTIAGNRTAGFSGDQGPAIAAQIQFPYGITTDTAGNVYIADQGTHHIRKVDMATGIISTIAGNGLGDYNGDDIPANTASLNSPSGILFDTAGTLYIADKSNNRIRILVPAPAEPYKGYLSGSVFFDDNANGIKDASEPWADGVTISTSNSEFEIQTVSKNGEFKIQVDTGTYTSKVLHLDYYNSSPASITTSFTNQVTADSISFALQPIPGKNDLQVNLISTSPARLGSPAHYRISYKNIGTTTANNVKLVFIKSSKLSIDGTLPAYSNISGDTLTWQLNPLNRNQEGIIDIDAKLATIPIANINDSLYSSAIISMSAADITPNDDTARLKQRVTGSFDPNDKTETHGGALTPAQVVSGEYLNYVIRFQNTGNDTAFKVEIRDTLEAKFDVASLQFIAASHPYQLTLTDGNKLSWQFDNILLPDSNTNEKASHGYIAFKIKLQPTVIAGDIIENRSGIYFDFNPPVQTNIAVTKIKALPASPVKPIVAYPSLKYCSTTGQQKFKITNLKTGYTARAFIGSNIIPINGDTTFNFTPQQLQVGNYAVRVEYVNETGENSINSSISILQPVTPEVKISANKTIVTTVADVVTVSALNKQGGGNNPLYSFAKDRNFTSSIQAEGPLNSTSIIADNLANGDNWIFVRMKTSDTCFTSSTSIDSIRVTKQLLTTGIIDIDNPGIIITGYPNPFNNEITISGLLTSKTYNIQVYDAKGSLKYSRVINHGALHQVNTSGWNKGMYWVTVYDVKKNKLIGTLTAIKP